MKLQYKDIKYARKQAGILLKKLNEAAGIGEKTDTGFEYAAQNYQIDQIEEILRGMDIEKMSAVSSGLRLSLLKENGINTVYDLYHTSEAKLIALSGIGPDTAEKLIRAVNYIARSISLSLPLRISADNPGDRELRLLKAIWLKMNHDDDSRRGISLKETYEAELKDSRRTLQESASALRWIFSLPRTRNRLSETAEKILAADRAVSPELDDILFRFRRDESASNEEILRDFRKNAASYYAFLDQFRPEPEAEALPDQITAEVNSLTLRTEHLRAVLRHYQEFGAKYIVSRDNTLLGDEMGLGKTVEALAAAVHLYNGGASHFLVVCPLGILSGWLKETERFTDFHPVMIRKDLQGQFDQWAEEGGFAVTNYESLSRLKIPEDLKIDLLIADEAHYVKNPKAIRTRALLTFAGKADHVLYMTGTPLENRPEEMLYLIRCLNPAVADDIADILYLSEAELFRQKTAPVYLRRKREDVLKELPELSRFDAWTDMTESEIDAYLRTVAEGNFMAMRRVSWNAHESMKAVRLLELCGQARQDGRKTVIFSQFLDTISFVYELLKDDCPPPVTGSVPPQKRLQIIEDFSSDPDLHFLILQIQAGGIGQNIQAANIVIFCEPQIKPSLENQALSRVYRMGQVNHVFSYRLLSAGSVDERIIELLEEKQHAFDLYADNSSVADSEVTSANMKKIIEEEQKKWGLPTSSNDISIPDV